ncbi:hypothetical protein Tco_0803447 [Tanacetum coccineum]|uniref:Reverse transcriptase domain-containing protein n=1 Tax=Tanacetum coccineum TaxID=301880 RepID=A0ABQ5A1N5_9ASTR
MLKRCEDTNLSLNWEKSHFMVKEGIVLGHKISKSGIEVDRAKVEVIAKLPHPTTVKGAVPSLQMEQIILVRLSLLIKWVEQSGSPPKMPELREEFLKTLIHPIWVPLIPFFPFSDCEDSIFSCIAAVMPLEFHMILWSFHNGNPIPKSNSTNVLSFGYRITIFINGPLDIPVGAHPGACPPLPAPVPGAGAHPL